MADGLLRDTFGFHPLAVQDAEHFGQRPKIDAYDDFTLMVVYGATGSASQTRRPAPRDPAGALAPGTAAEGTSATLAPWGTNRTPTG